jgi:hypothetical protein
MQDRLGKRNYDKLEKVSQLPLIIAAIRLSIRFERQSLLGEQKHTSLGLNLPLFVLGPLHIIFAALFLMSILMSDFFLFCFLIS